MAVMVAFIQCAGCSADPTPPPSTAPKKAKIVEEFPLANWTGRRENVVWKTIDTATLQMDIYYPLTASDSKAPAHVYLHGGGWVAGKKEQPRQNGEVGRVFVHLAQRGFFGFSIDYRLIESTDRILLLHQITDCKDAMRFIHKNAETWNIDPNRIAIWGSSAGSHLAMMTALTKNDEFPGVPELRNYPSNVRCCVSWYGFTDFTDAEIISDSSLSRDVSRLFAASYENDKDAWKRGSPLSYLSINSTPIMHIHGQLDEVVPFSQAMRLQREALRRDADVLVLPVLNTGHQWYVENTDTVPSAEDICKITADYIVEYTRVDREKHSGWVSGQRLRQRKPRQESSESVGVE